MTVFLLIEEYEQDLFLNKRKEPASPFSVVLGVYEKKERAEREKQFLDEQKDNTQCSYFIEERPIL